MPRLCNEDVSFFHCLADGLFGAAVVKGLQRILESVGLTLFAVVRGSQEQDDIITLRQMCVCVTATLCFLLHFLNYFFLLKQHRFDMQKYEK